MVMISRVSGDLPKKVFVNIRIPHIRGTRDDMIDGLTSGTHVVAVYAAMTYY